MNPTLIYFVKVNIAIALFYLFYRLFFANDTFWKTRRVYLIFSILMSFAYPVLSIAGWLQNQEPVQALVMGYAQLQEFTVTANASASLFTFENIMLTIYVLVTTGLVIRLLIQLFSILSIRIKNKTEIISNQKVIVVNKDITPFSFFGNIYLNPSLHSEEELNQILIHELTHVRQLHSLDVILSELVCIAFWFNPAAWLLKREIRQNLEYLADNKVLKSGFDSKSYQYHLVQLSYQTPDYKLTNNFNVLPLKKRIIMMNQQKSHKSSALKYMLIVPLTFSLVLLSNAETFAQSASNALQKNKKDTNLNELTITSKTITRETNNQSKPKDLTEVTVTAFARAEQKENITQVQENTTTTTKDDDVVFTVVDKMPTFPGGDSELFKFLANNVRYPVEAQEKGIQGRVICQFVVKSDGSIADVVVVRPVDPSLDKEALRVIEAMPKWTPGMQREKAVDVKFTLPVNFRLDGGDEKNPWGDKPLVKLDGQTMLPGFDPNIIRPESIEKIEVNKPDTEERKKELIEKYGKWAGNGVVLITTKK